MRQRKGGRDRAEILLSCSFSVRRIVWREKKCPVLRSQHKSQVSPYRPSEHPLPTTLISCTGTTSNSCRRPHQALLVAEMFPSQRLSRQVPQPLHEGDVATVEALRRHENGWGRQVWGERWCSSEMFVRLDFWSRHVYGFHSRDASKALVGDFSEAVAAAGRFVLPGTLFPTTMPTYRPSLQPTHPDSSTALLGAAHRSRARR